MFSNDSLSVITTYVSHVMGKEPLLHMRPAKVQASLRIRAVSPEPILFAHLCSRARGDSQPKNEACSHAKRPGMRT